MLLSLDVGVNDWKPAVNLPYFKPVCHRFISYILTQVGKI